MNDDIIQSAPSDTMEQYLRGTSIDCWQYHDAYWREYYTYKLLHDIVSVPLIVLSSGTVLVSQVGNTSMDRPTATYIVAGLGIITTLLSGLQRYMRFGERAITCRNLAKSFDRIARKIDVTVSMYESDINMSMTPRDLRNFNIHIQKEIDGIMNETEDLPVIIMKHRDSVTDHNHVIYHRATTPPHETTTTSRRRRSTQNSNPRNRHMDRIPTTTVRSRSDSPSATPRTYDNTLRRSGSFTDDKSRRMILLPPSRTTSDSLV